MIKNNNLSFENYLALKRNNRLSELALHKTHIHQSMCRYALIDHLVHDFDYDYWLVITFGYFPQFSDVEVVLSNAHYRLDRWLLTNLKLNHMRIDQRSQWVCLPEKGGSGLHYNCFVKFNESPESKTYNDEWNAIRNAMKTTFKSISKMMGWKEHTIQFRLKERKNCQNALQQCVYSTKDMRQGYINENGDDHFSKFFMSWKDFDVAPLNKRSPKHLKSKPKPSGTLEGFMTN